MQVEKLYNIVYIPDMGGKLMKTFIIIVSIELGFLVSISFPPLEGGLVFFV
jgi:hypothetical protein